MKDIALKIKPYLTWNLLFILIFVGGYGFYFMFMPGVVDDYWFTIRFRHWFEQQGVLYPDQGGNIFKAGMPWQEIWETIKFHYYDDNARLTNILAIFLLLLPKWFGCGLMTILLGWSVFVAYRLAGVDWRKSPLVPVSLLLWILFVPWNDNMGGLDYQLNYIFPLWLGLMLTSSLRRHIDDGRWKASAIWALFLALAHEGIGAPMLAGLCAQTLVYRDWRKRGVIISMIILAAGIIWLMTVPGMMARTGLHLDSPYGAEVKWWYVTVLMKNYAVPFELSLILCIVSLIRRRRAIFKSDGMLLFWFVNIVVSSPFVFFLFAPMRAFMWASFCSLIPLMELLKVNFRWLSGGYNRWTAMATAVVMTLITAHVVELAKITVRCRKTSHEIVAHYVKYPYDNLFGDPMMPMHSNVLAYDMPGIYFTNDSHSFLPYYFGYLEFKFDEVTDEIYMPPQQRSTAVVPSNLEYVTEKSGRDVSHGDGIREKDGYYFMPLTLAPELDKRKTLWEFVRIKITVDFGKGPRPITSMTRQFKSKADGKEYLWIPLNFNWYMHHFKTLHTIRFEGYDLKKGKSREK